VGGGVGFDGVVVVGLLYDCLPIGWKALRVKVLFFVSVLR
jgi:hypothetical protein